MSCLGTCLWMSKLKTGLTLVVSLYWRPNCLKWTRVPGSWGQCRHRWSGINPFWTVLLFWRSCLVPIVGHGWWPKTHFRHSPKILLDFINAHHLWATNTSSDGWFLVNVAAVLESKPYVQISLSGVIHTWEVALWWSYQWWISLISHASWSR